MKIKIPFFLRGCIVLALTAIYWLLLLGNKIDDLFPVMIYFITVALSAFTGSMSYGILLGKRAIKAAQEQMKMQNRNPYADSTPKSRAIGYFGWIGSMILLNIAVTVVYHFQLAGYF